VASDVTDSFGRFAVSLPGGQYSVSIVHDWFQIEGGDMTLNVTADNNSVAIRAEGQAGEAAVTPLGAQKDTSMLVTRNAINRSGAGWMCDKDNTGDQAWDAPHAHPHNGFDGGQEWQEGWYCWAVSACMIARYYGGTVTRDEIVEESKDTRLGFGSENAAFDYEEQRALRFALQATDAQIHYTYTKRTWNEVVNAIDAGRPIFYVEAGHVMTIDAYEFRSGPSGDAQFWCRFVNRDNLGAKPFLNYDTMSWWRGAIPDSGLTGRTTDSRVSADYDSDGALDHTSDDDSDGICNYDEEVRFRRGRAIYLDFADCGALGANSSDTDNDKIADKREVESWVFPRPTEKPRKGDISALTEKDFNLPDVDNDHKYPEVDDDSDDGGIKDGDEDADHNGVFGDEETDVFDKNDDGSLDLVFCIDNTGSMRDDIDAVKAQAINIVNETAAQFKDFRIAVVAYRDFPVDPYGDPGDFVTRDCLGFSTNKSAIVAAINSMGADGGADWDEAVYSAIMHCIDGSTLGGWRKAPVQRKILVMGDAPPHDPEPFTGYTLAGVTAAASAGGVVWEEPYTGSSTKGDDEEHSGPISAITILIGSDSGALASFTDIARETDGTLIRAAIAGDVPRAVLEALERIKTDPIAILEVNGNYRDTNIVADASKSVDGDGCGIVLYEWDWNGDGVYDETTFTPTVPHDYTTGFGGKVRVRITTVAGKTATASYIILVPEFIDVTQYVDLESLASHLDRASGAIVCDIVLGNKTDTVKTMRDKFYFAIPSTTNMFLANPDGTLEDGTPYADITALVEAALPSIGDGDLELDPGETVRLEDAIKIYSRDRSMPVGFVFAVWADPLRSAPIHYATASPTLKAVHLPNKLLELSWSASLSEYQLEVADSLASSSWTTVSETPMLQAQQNSVTVPIGAGAKFYRLKQK